MTEEDDGLALDCMRTSRESEERLGYRPTGCALKVSGGLQTIDRVVRPTGLAAGADDQVPRIVGARG